MSFFPLSWTCFFSDCFSSRFINSTIKPKKRSKRRENLDLPHSFFLFTSTRRTDANSRRTTHTYPFYTQNLQKNRKRKKKKKVKKDKISQCAFVPSLFLLFSIGLSSIGAVNIHRITRANVKWAGNDGDQSGESTRDGDPFFSFCPLHLLFYRHS